MQYMAAHTYLGVHYPSDVGAGLARPLDAVLGGECSLWGADRVHEPRAAPRRPVLDEPRSRRQGCGRPLHQPRDRVSPRRPAGRKALYTAYVSHKTETARARSIHEMHFAASLEPCPKCGARIDPQQLSLAGDGDGWTLSGDCLRCRTTRGFSFLTYGDPLTAPSPRDEVGGPKPSEIVKPSRWLAEIDQSSRRSHRPGW